MLMNAVRSCGRWPKQNKATSAIGNDSLVPRTKKNRSSKASVVESVYTRDLKSLASACGFESHHSHQQQIWGVSSIGRAPVLQAGGRRFDPVTLHQIKFGVWRSPVAHLLWEQGVQGSNPCTPTTNSFSRTYSVPAQTAYSSAG